MNAPVCFYVVDNLLEITFLIGNQNLQSFNKTLVKSTEL